MSEKIRLTTAQALVKFLNQQYISVDGEEKPFVAGIFSIFGHGNVLGLGQALQEDAGHLQVISGKNEQGMTHAATAYSREKLRQQIFAVTASAGPGSANMITAAGTAFANNIPVLILPADTFATRQPDPVLQQLEHETSLAMTTNDAFKAVSKYWDRIQRPEQLMSSLLRAFEVMTNPATAGPVTICLPQDTEGEAYDFDVEFFKKRVHYLDRKLPTKREINGAIELIKNSKKPVIIVGGGARYSQAGEELKILAKQCNIPLVETPAGKSTVESTFENNLGGTGILGTLAANKVVRQADLIIGIGTRYTDFTTSSKTAFDFENSKFLNINVNRMQAYKMDAFQVVADAKATLMELIPALAGYMTEFGDELLETKAQWQKERTRLANTKYQSEGFKPEIAGHFTQNDFEKYVTELGTTFTQTEAFITINDTVAKGSIALAAAGSLPGDMQRLWETSTPNTYHLEYGYSCMGYEVNGAFGAKLAHPDKEVYAFLGDGSFLMGHSELVTSLQHGKKINVLLFDNSGFGCINNLQMSNGSDSYQCEFRDSNDQVLNINYSQVAAGYGAKTYRVTNKEELIAALNDAKKQTKSTLIEIKVLPKTMSDGYDSWWHVGVSETSAKPQVIEAYQAMKDKLMTAKEY